MISVYDLWLLQSGECYYCGCETWVEGMESHKSVMNRLGLTTAKARRRQMATREHIHRKADGGTNMLFNLVMACSLCNGLRGEKPSLLHLAERRNARP